MSEITVDRVIAAYVKTRDAIDEINAKAKADCRELNDKLQKQAAWLQRHLEESGAKSIKTDYGTVYINVTESVKVADWDELLDYIKGEDAFELLNKAVNKTAVLEIMGDKRENPTPPGVKYVAIREARVRRAT